MTNPDLRKAQKNFLIGETPGFGDDKPKAKPKAYRSKTLSTIVRQYSFDDTRKLYRTNTEPISSEGMFAGSFKDDNYYRTFVEDAQLTEQEVFYKETNEEKKDEETRSCKGLCCCLRKSKSKSKPKLLIKNTTVDQGKLNKILVGIYLSWDDEKFDVLFPKIELLLGAKADINTTWGGGIFSQPLIARVFYSEHEKLRRALINAADYESLEPKEGQSLFALACERTNYSMMDLLLKKNSEPNRIEDNGMTPLITLCKSWTHREEDTDYVEQLNCIKLLVTFEGPDAKKLKRNWAVKFEKICPDSIGQAWYEVADFCIPNINVLPKSRGQTAEDHLDSYKNPELFRTRGMALLRHLFNDAKLQKETYWPKDRDIYKKMFKSKWE